MAKLKPSVCRLNVILCNDSAERDSYTSLSAAIDDLFEVMTCLKNLHSWMNLGLALGLLYPTLEKIKQENDKIDDCKREMLAAWLRKHDKVSQEGFPSWSVLHAALKKVDENELADKILPRLCDGQL